jgi:hypothetical protein
MNLHIGILGYEDSPQTSAPKLVDVDWRRDLRGLALTTSSGRIPLAPVDPGAAVTVFSGTRALGVDGTTTFTVSQSKLSPSQYFLTWTGGTAPGFRTDRGLTLSGSTLAVTPQGNGSVLFAVTAGGGVFTGLVAGDNVFLPGLSTGAPAGPFSPGNEGLWVVLSLTDASDVVLVRPPGSSSGSAAQTGVVVTDNAQFQGFSADGVQAGDEADISAGVGSPSPLLSTFDVLAATAQQLTLVSTNPLPMVTGFTPTAAGLSCYSQGYDFLYLEADQECAVRTNGDAGSTQRLGPWSPGTPGSYLKTGPTWSLVVVNRSINPLNLLVIVAGL